MAPDATYDVFLSHANQDKPVPLSCAVRPNLALRLRVRAGAILCALLRPTPLGAASMTEPSSGRASIDDLQQTSLTILYPLAHL